MVLLEVYPADATLKMHRCFQISNECDKQVQVQCLNAFTVHRYKVLTNRLIIGILSINMHNAVLGFTSATEKKKLEHIDSTT